MAVPLPLSLEPVIPTPDGQGAISGLLRRIKDERGALRNVTESSLREEIGLAAGEHTDQQTQDEHEPTHQDLETRRKELDQARNSMIEKISVAHNQVLIALDFVSFLLKKDAPRQADLTMSPMLKDLYPQGMLAFDSLDKPNKDQDQLRDDNLTSTGWNEQGLDQVAESLLEAASNLECEVERETRHWTDVLSIREKKWSLCRMPRQRNAIGVRFGFREASPMFNARSLATLRPGKSGAASLDQSSSTEPKSIRVRVQKGKRILSDSFASEPFSPATDIEGQIHQARDSLFEQELFHETEMEARSLLALGVKRVGSAIHIPDKSADRSLKVTLESRTTRFPNSQTSTPNTDEARTIVSTLRLLFADVYRQRLETRSRPPAPLTGERQEAGDRHLLRTLLVLIDGGYDPKLRSLGGLFPTSSIYTGVVSE